MNKAAVRTHGLLSLADLLMHRRNLPKPRPRLPPSPLYPSLLPNRIILLPRNRFRLNTHLSRITLKRLPLVGLLLLEGKIQPANSPNSNIPQARLRISLLALAFLEVRCLNNIGQALVGCTTWVLLRHLGHMLHLMRCSRNAPFLVIRHILPLLPNHASLTRNLHITLNTSITNNRSINNMPTHLPVCLFLLGITRGVANRFTSNLQGYHYQALPSEYRSSQESSSHGDGRTVYLEQERELDNVTPQSPNPYSTNPVAQSSQQHYSSISPSQYYASDPRSGQMQTVPPLNMMQQPHSPIQQMPYEPHTHYQIRNSPPSGSWTNMSIQAQQGSFAYRAPRDSSTLTYPVPHPMDDSGRPGSGPSTFDVIAHDKRPDDSAQPPTPTQRNTNLTLPPLRGVPPHQHHPGTAQTTSLHHHHHQGHHASQYQHQLIPTHSNYSQGHPAAPVQSPSSVSYNTGHRYGPTLVDSSLFGAPHSSYHWQAPDPGMNVPAGAIPNNIPIPHSPIILPLPNRDPNTTVKMNMLGNGHISDHSGS